MKACVILCCLVVLAAANGNSKPYGPGRLRPICPRFKSKLTGVSTSSNGYPGKSIKAALAKNKAISRELVNRKSQRGELFSHNAQSKVTAKFSRCPSFLRRVWKAYGCWVYWPVVKTAQCKTRYCRLHRPWWPIKPRGTCRPHNYVTYKFVLLACPRRPYYWTFRWAKITVARSCVCWPCWR